MMRMAHPEASDRPGSLASLLGLGLAPHLTSVLLQVPTSGRAGVNHMMMLAASKNKTNAKVATAAPPLPEEKGSLEGPLC